MLIDRDVVLMVHRVVSWLGCFFMSYSKFSCIEWIKPVQMFSVYRECKLYIVEEALDVVSELDAVHVHDLMT